MSDDDVRGTFLVFEGVEGSGKSSQIGRLADLLTRLRRPHLVTREPGGTPLGDALRALLLSPASSGIDGLTELYLLEASRRTHVRQVILPAMAQGRIVICDRYGDSSVAYQGGGRRLGIDLVETLNRQATDDLQPDITLLLDVRPEVGLERIGRRPGAQDRMEREALAFHRRVREAYLEVARRGGERYRVIDGEAAPDRVFSEILEALRPLLPWIPPSEGP